jgi:DeoR/GlpR family transcriptional regulator of sugar metabolism
MIQYERQQNILQYLEKHHTATVKQLAKTVYASEASVRRDLNLLEKQGVVSRVYGGVILSKYQNAVVPLVLRKQENISQKEWIAQRAAKLVSDGTTIFIDASSTAGRIVKYLNGLHNLRIITNSLNVVEEAAKNNIEVWSTGGKYFSANRALVGPYADNFLRSVNIDILFFSSQGITIDGKISDVSERETALRRVALENSKRKVFLCDASKIGVQRTFFLCTRFDVDDIICDKALPWEDENNENK